MILIVKEGQSILDMTLQGYGIISDDTNNYFIKLVVDNSLELDTELSVGQEIIIDETLGDETIKRIITQKDLIYKNGITSTVVSSLVPLTSDSTLYTADSTLITADQTLI